MQVLFYGMMLAGAAGMSLGFYLCGERVRVRAGIALLFAGFLLTFLGVLLAFAPGFFG